MWTNIKKRSLRFIIQVLSIAFIIFQIIFYLSQQGAKLDTVPVGIETILIFIFIFFFFYEQFVSVKDQFIYSHYCFWFCIGILIYLGGAFFFNLLADHMANNDYWYITYIIQTVTNILFTVGLYIYIKMPEPALLDKNSKIPYLDIDLT